MNPNLFVFCIRFLVSGLEVDSAFTSDPASGCVGLAKNDLPVVAQYINQTSTQLVCLPTTKQQGVNYLPADSNVQVWCENEPVSDQRYCTPGFSSKPF